MSLALLWGWEGKMASEEERREDAGTRSKSGKGRVVKRAQRVGGNGAEEEGGKMKVSPVQRSQQSQS
ncbi:hypothetical protein BCR35DRAFT_310339 [Leucosporidium creatinivorum]|uniref:Uncharacterized protein n=1 Tax=Leucosporidium creatinivorum TaxID=106004 RepID=A0A1Y2D5K6_9BASI|nr:hypothetical protein BCR35DRAFT_310339 [Leucosporidium creatinivorum]